MKGKRQGACAEEGSNRCAEGWCACSTLSGNGAQACPCAALQPLPLRYSPLVRLLSKQRRSQTKRLVRRAQRCPAAGGGTPASRPRCCHTPEHARLKEGGGLNVRAGMRHAGCLFPAAAPLARGCMRLGRRGAPARSPAGMLCSGPLQQACRCSAWLSASAAQAGRLPPAPQRSLHPSKPCHPR